MSVCMMPSFVKLELSFSRNFYYGSGSATTEFENSIDDIVKTAERSLNLSDLLASDSSQSTSHWGQEAVSAEPCPTFLFPIEASPVLPALPQSGSIGTTVAEKENRCHLCGIRFTQSQVLNRHMRDKHEDKMSCPYCLSFKWSRGRPYLYRRHLHVKHLEVTVGISAGARQYGPRLRLYPRI